LQQLKESKETNFSVSFVNEMLANETLDINQTDNYGVNAFWIAAFYNHVEMLKFLI